MADAASVYTSKKELIGGSRGIQSMETDDRKLNQ